MSCEQTIEAISEDPTLDSRFENGTFDFEVGNIAGCCYIADGFAGSYDEDGHHGKNEGTVDNQGKCVVQMKETAGAWIPRLIRVSISVENVKLTATIPALSK